MTRPEKRSLVMWAILAASGASPAAASAAQTLHPANVLALSAPAARTSTSCNLDRTDALAVAFGRSPVERAYVGAGLLGVLFQDDGLAPLPIAAVCDDARFAREAGGLGIGGTLADARPVSDAIGRGYRALEAPAWQQVGGSDDDDDGELVPGRAGGLIPGDSLTLPATEGTGSSAVWVQAGSGTQRLTFPAGPATQVTVRSAADGAVDVIATRDGQPQTTRVTALPRVQVTATGRVRRGILRAEISGLPAGATIVAGSTKRPKVATATDGTARVALRSKRATFDVLWLDLATRRASAVICSAAPAKRPCRSSSATLAATASERLAARTQAQVASAAAGPVLPVAHPAPSAHAARATTAAALRFPMRVVPLDVPTASIAAGDVNGDGHTDFLGSGGASSAALAQLYLSKPDGTRGAAVPFDAGFVRAAGDIDGDGHGDTLIQGGRIAFGTGDAASLSPAANIDAPNDPRVLRLVAPDDEELPDGPDAAGPVDNVTGDGRPELAARYEGAGMVFASEQISRGGTLEIPREVDLPLPDENGDVSEWPEPLVEPHGITGLRVVRAPSRKQPIAQVQIERTSAAGAVSRSTILELRGYPNALERDPVSGELLVAATASSNRRSSVTTVLHLDAAGNPLARTAIRNAGAVRFGPDGPDADGVAEVFISTWGGVRVLPSASRGSMSGRSLLFVTDARGRVLPASMPSEDSGSGEGATPRSLSVTGLGDWKFPADHWSRLLPLS